MDDEAGENEETNTLFSDEVHLLFILSTSLPTNDHCIFPASRASLLLLRSLHAAAMPSTQDSYLLAIGHPLFRDRTLMSIGQ